MDKKKERSSKVSAEKQENSHHATHGESHGLNMNETPDQQKADNSNLKDFRGASCQDGKKLSNNEQSSSNNREKLSQPTSQFADLFKQFDRLAVKKETFAPHESCPIKKPDCFEKSLASFQSAHQISQSFHTVTEKCSKDASTSRMHEEPIKGSHYPSLSCSSEDSDTITISESVDEEDDTKTILLNESENIGEKISNDENVETSSAKNLPFSNKNFKGDHIMEEIKKAEESMDTQQDYLRNELCVLNESDSSDLSEKSNDDLVSARRKSQSVDSVVEKCTDNAYADLSKMHEESVNDLPTSCLHEIKNREAILSESQDKVSDLFPPNESATSEDNEAASFNESAEIADEISHEESAEVSSAKSIPFSDKHTETDHCMEEINEGEKSINTQLDYSPKEFSEINKLAPNDSSKISFADFQRTSGKDETLDSFAEKNTEDIHQAEVNDKSSHPDSTEEFDSSGDNKIVPLYSYVSKDITNENTGAFATSNAKSLHNLENRLKENLDMKAIKDDKYPEGNLKDSCNIYESVSKNGDEYIKKIPNDHGFVYQSQLIIGNTNPPYKLNIGNLGEESLLVANNDRFIARIEILANTQLSQSFKDDKLAFLKNILITKILEDELMLKKTDAYNKFLQSIERRSANISNSIECADDFLQLLLMTKSYRLTSRSLMFLKKMLENKHMSQALKNDIKYFWKIENRLHDRNQYFPEFSRASDPLTKDLSETVRNICVAGIEKYKQNLIKSCPAKNAYLLSHFLSIANLPKDKVLFINHKDIELFANIVAVDQDEISLANRMIPPDFVKYLWEKFYSQVRLLNHKSVREAGPLTHPIYPFLLKSFRDVVLEIASKLNMEPQELLFTENRNLRIKNAFPWTSNSPVNISLEKQYQLYFDLLAHFEPGSYSAEKRFKYSFKLINGDINMIKSIKNFFFGEKDNFINLPEDRLVWLYIVDCGTDPLLRNDPSNRFQELSLHVFKGFVKFVEEAKQDRYESFRIAAFNINKFFMQFSPYLSETNSVLTDLDYIILDKQAQFINGILNSDEMNTPFDYFSNLMDTYKEYWELRGTILEDMELDGSLFKCEMKDILTKILKIVEMSLSKCSETKLVIRFFRFFNEFLKHLKGIDFSWIISNTFYTNDLINVVMINKKNVTSYIVKDPGNFVKILKRKNATIPPHFLIETVKKLLDIIIMVFEKLHWSNEDCLNAVGDLFLAIGHSFAHFEDQADYTDLEHFLRDCTAPFFSVVTKSSTYADFKSRLDTVEKFFLYARKQNQLGVQRALELCELEVVKAHESGFSTCINKSVLVTCYNLYYDKFISIQHLGIPQILAEIDRELSMVTCEPLEQWMPNFKQKTIPVLLAGVAMVWSKLESKDIEITHKRIEPHCVQILCILRLLGVDIFMKGVSKHFAQILTGQGKSVVFGLLSVVIALTGNEACVVCYSEYLAVRDQKAFYPFFQYFFPDDTSLKIHYKTLGRVVPDSLNLKVDRFKKDIRTAVRDLVLNNLKPQSIEFCENRLTSVLLIDEADVFFSDNFYGSTCNPLVSIEMAALLEIQPKLWKIVEGGLYEKNVVMEKIRDFIAELLKDKKHDEFKRFTSETNFLFELHLEKMVSNAISVSKEKNENVWFIERYKINFNGLICYRDNFGTYIPYFYNDYYNVFNYFRLKKENFDDKVYKNYGYFQISCGSISYANFPTRYKNILGVSGTLMTLDESEKTAMKNYGIKTMSAMPSFFGERKLIFNPTSHCTIQDTESNWHSKIFEHIYQNIKLNRAVLVFFDTDTEVKAFEEKYASNINRLYVLIGNEEPSVMEWRINEAGVAQTVTLATRAMGRGIDYKSNDRSVEENGGVHVIQTFFSLDEKEETQIKGRTARKDNKGSYELVLCREHLKKNGCSHTTSIGSPIITYGELCIARNEIAKAREIRVASNIKNAEEKHNLTFKFFESLAHYTPEKRVRYLHQYPFTEITIKKKNYI